MGQYLELTKGQRYLKFPGARTESPSNLPASEGQGLASVDELPSANSCSGPTEENLKPSHK